MKRTISALLAIFMIFSLAACGEKKQEESPIKKGAPTIKTVEVNESYKDSKGKVSFVINISIPNIEGVCSEQYALIINATMNDYIREAKIFAEKNIENASAFMQSENSESPWSRTVRYETTYADANYICFLVEEMFSFGGKESSSVFKSFCYDLKKEIRIDALTFAKETEKQLTEDILPFIVRDINANFYPNGTKVSPEQRDNLKLNFRYYNFYIDGENICFFFPKEVIDGTSSGYYFSKLPLSTVFNYFMSPDELATKKSDFE